ncbi:MAG: hypothetical protein OWT28_13200 [Firmicutes bacterium]|nr:hypothetical protein [Bacillota bacterium]
MVEGRQEQGRPQGITKVFGRRTLQEAQQSEGPAVAASVLPGMPQEEPLTPTVAPRRVVFGAKRSDPAALSAHAEAAPGVLTTPVVADAKDAPEAIQDTGSPLLDAGYAFVPATAQTPAASETSETSEAPVPVPVAQPELALTMEAVRERDMVDEPLIPAASEEPIAFAPVEQALPMETPAEPDVSAAQEQQELQPFTLLEAEAVAPEPEAKLDSPMYQVVQAFARKVHEQLHPGEDETGDDSPQVTLPQEADEEPANNPLDAGLTDELRHLLAEKEEEFHLLGYAEVTANDIWQYLCALRKNRPANLHDLVNAVLSLQPQAYMNYVMRSMYRAASLDEFKEML